MVFRVKTLERFTIDSQPRLVKRPFTMMKPVAIPSDRFEDARPKQKPKSEPHLAKPRIEVPRSKPSAKIPDAALDKVTFTPTADLANRILSQKPRVEPSSSVSNALPQDAGEMAAMDKQLIEKLTPKIPAASDFKLPPSSSETSRGGGDSADGSAQAGSNLDDLLAKSVSGELTGSVAPLSMKGGALFDYDKAVLRSDAIETLQKLGELIRRNPRATFTIEGHSDAFGKPDYNQKLSEARAESVKAWLVKNMQLDPASIETRGYGSKRLKVPATASMEAQEINRRVEIVIKTPKE